MYEPQRTRPYLVGLPSPAAGLEFPELITADHGETSYSCPAIAPGETPRARARGPMGRRLQRTPPRRCRFIFVRRCPALRRQPVLCLLRMQGELRMAVSRKAMLRMAVVIMKNLTRKCGGPRDRVRRGCYWAGSDGCDTFSLPMLLVLRSARDDTHP